MAETKRKPPNAGKGRPKGSQNKVNRAFKEAVLAVYQDIGGNEALAKWARKNPTEFYKICARLIPTEVNANIGATQYVVRVSEPCATTEEWERRYALPQEPPKH